MDYFYRNILKVIVFKDIPIKSNIWKHCYFFFSYNIGYHYFLEYFQLYKSNNPLYYFQFSILYLIKLYSTLQWHYFNVVIMSNDLSLF